MTAYAADLQSVREAASRIAPYAHRTPVMTCSTIDELAGRSLFFKCELFQKAGSFKFRGACNAVMKLPDEEAHRGVVTHSSGNHAQALALAAKLRCCQAHIVMPRTASPIKRQSVEGYGGKIYLCEPTLAARESMAAELAEQTGAVMIPPYDHPDIIAGQGTAAFELLGQVDNLDAIIAPIGGGGLISGTCITAMAINPNIRVFGAEPVGADDAARSQAAGRFIPQTNPNTICDGLLTSLGELTWPIVRDHVQRIITVDDEKIIAAMRLIWQRMKLIIEPSAAVAVAAVLGDEFKSVPLGSSPSSGGVGVILSGGNADLDHLPW
ncbi:MAG: pyridoxal-phosphate dependent enzyme [Planctomycetes bacterium]|nr:pyridoxal-phosphate dependent enzyme [Planctomycetota bacterium]